MVGIPLRAFFCMRWEQGEVEEEKRKGAEAVAAERERGAEAAEEARRRAGEEAEEAAQEQMEDLRYSLSELLEEERSARQSTEEAALQRVQEVEAQVRIGRSKKNPRPGLQRELSAVLTSLPFFRE